MTPALRNILRHLIGSSDALKSLAIIDAFIARETNNRFIELAQFNGPLATPEENKQRDDILRKISDALDTNELESLTEQDKP